MAIVIGSMAGEWLGIQQRLGVLENFGLEHQGYEHVDLGRCWQIFLVVGLFVWLGLIWGALWPAIKAPRENRSLLSLFFIASAAIALFYGAGLMCGRQTNLAIAEYWRWWVIHLWVEGVFEVFATVVIAVSLVRLDLLRLFSHDVFLRRNRGARVVRSGTQDRLVNQARARIDLGGSSKRILVQ